MSRRSRKKPTTAPVAHPSPPAAGPRAHRFGWLALLLALAATAATIAWFGLRPRDATVPAVHPPAVSMTPASFVGSTACASCHARETAAWQGSDHRLAMQHASAESVLGDFNDTRFRHGGVESRFFKRDNRFFVRTDGPGGKLDDFEVRYTFGARPLQQYLIEFPDGRLQALSIAWDSRPAKDGGQRWFHLYGNEKIDHRDELHWTKGQQNWNFMCADCHSVDLRKGYDAATNRFASTWKDLTVGCEACHGPGSTHIAWAAGRNASVGHKGLTVAFDQRRGVAWPIDPATGNARRSVEKKGDTEIEVCAQCHARRAQIAEGHHAGKPFLDHYRPALLTPPLYYADGQQRDEVYTWGSFLQSRMYMKGVTCSDCHEPHSLKLRAEGNAVCAQCHLPARYDAPSHSHHAAGTAGSRCVDCHMPSTNYMVIDGRRDHGMRVPRPDLTVSTGSPNVCNACHRDKDARWADAALMGWLGRRPSGLQNYAEAFAALAKGSATANGALLAVARDLSQPGIARATAVHGLTADNPAAREEIQRSLQAADPLVRMAAVGALEGIEPQQRVLLAGPLLADPLRVVRIEAARALAPIDASALGQFQSAFDRAAAEYVATLRYTSDRPEARTALATYFGQRGQLAEADAEFDAAIALDPGFVPAYVNRADLARVQSDEVAAERALRAGLAQVPRDASLQHALGLSLVRQKRLPEATAALKQATRLAPDNTRYAYVYAVALSSTSPRAALDEINRALLLQPDDRELLLAGASIAQGAGLDGNRYLKALQEKYPQAAGKRP